jgi:hypothetical protein
VGESEAKAVRVAFSVIYSLMVDPVKLDKLLWLHEGDFLIGRRGKDLVGAPLHVVLYASVSMRMSIIR